MPLPLDRNTTYTASDPVKSPDLNELQDCAIVGAHGELPFVVSAIEGRDVNASGTFNENPLYWKSGAAPDVLTVPLPLKPGDRLKSLSHTHYSGGAGNKDFEVYVQAATGAYTLVPTWSSTVNPADLSVVLQAQAGTAYTLGAGEKLIVRFVTSHADDRYYQVAGVYDRLLP